MRSPTAALPWLLHTLDLLLLAVAAQINPLDAFVIIIPCSAVTNDTSAFSNAVQSHCANHNWIPQCSVINTATAGNLVSSLRWLAAGHRSAAPPAHSPFLFLFLFPPPANSLRAAYGPLVHAARKNRNEALLALCANTLHPFAPSPTTLTATPPSLSTRLSFAPLVPLACSPALDQALIISIRKSAAPSDHLLAPPVLPLVPLAGSAALDHALIISVPKHAAPPDPLIACSTCSASSPARCLCVPPSSIKTRSSAWYSASRSIGSPCCDRPCHLTCLLLCLCYTP